MKSLTNAELNRMTLAQFRRLPELDVRWDKDVRCSNLIILPTGKKHRGSGWGMMDLVPVLDGRILGRLVCQSDDYDFGRLLEIPGAWRLDCLWRARLLNVWRSGCYLVVRHRLSSTEIGFERREP